MCCVSPKPLWYRFSLRLFVSWRGRPTRLGGAVPGANGAQGARGLWQLSVECGGVVRWRAVRLKRPWNLARVVLLLGSSMDIKTNESSLFWTPFRSPRLLRGGLWEHWELGPGFLSSTAGTMHHGVLVESMSV